MKDASWLRAEHLPAHLRAAAHQNHAPDWVRLLSGIRVLQTEHRLVEGVRTQVGFALHRKTIQQAVDGHQPIRHACKNPSRVLEERGRKGPLSFGFFTKHFSAVLIFAVSVVCEQEFILNNSDPRHRSANPQVCVCVCVTCSRSGTGQRQVMMAGHEKSF